jgi:hypothetical protein
VDCFDKFDPLTGDVSCWPFFDLWRIAAEARDLLAGLSIDDIRCIEQDLDRTVFDTKEEAARIGLDEYVAEVIETGSWELSYLPADAAPTQQNVRRLLENWPSSAGELDHRVEGDYSDIEALRMAIWTGALGSGDSEHSYPVQCAAVLALMKVSECLCAMECPEDELGFHADGPIAARLVSAANDAIEAALALGLASTLAMELASAPLERKIEERQRRFNEERARMAATARHQHLGPAKLFVQTEWDRHREAYNFNKTDFARTYVELVRNKYRHRNGDPLKVTIKTITESWLAPSASKPAGEPADG